MDLSKFNDFFGLFAALNLAYAGSESFRDIIDMDILKLYDLEKKKAEAVQRLLDAVNTLKSTNESSIYEVPELMERIKSDLKIRADDFKSKYDKKFRALNIHRLRHEKYTDGFKSMFLITSLFCITIILIAGFDSDLSTETLNLLFILELCLFFNVFMFIRSFINRFVSKRFKASYTILIFLFLIGFHFLIAKIINLSALPFFITDKIKFYSILPFHFSRNVAVGIAVGISISTYLLHSLRALCHKEIFKFQYGKKIAGMLDDAKYESDILKQVSHQFMKAFNK